MVIFDEEPDLTSAEGIRGAMRHSYERHEEMAQEATLPPDTSVHEAAMYGVLSSFYEATGTSPATTARQEPLLWLDLLPFLHLAPQEGLEALIEYIIWKEPLTREEARQEWLVEKIRVGTVAATEEGWADQVRQAANVQGLGPLPWARLLAERAREKGP